MDLRISNASRQKLQVVHAGKWPNLTEFQESLAKKGRNFAATHRQ